jgi:HEAT repeat protein
MKAFRLAASGLVALALLAGCQPSTPDPSPTATVTPTSTPQVTAPVATPESSPKPSMESRIALVMATWDGQSFSATELERMENGPVFVEIIKTTDDEKIKASAFRALRVTYGSVLADATRNFGGAPSFVEVVRSHLNSKNLAVREGALRAAAHAMGNDPVPEVQSDLAKLLADSDDARVRFLAQEALDNTETRATDSVTSARLKALNDPKPFVVALVLHDLDVNDVRDQNALQDRLLELMQHTNPAVRGEAVKRLAEMPRTRVKAAIAAEHVKPLLKDPDPYPRGQAVIALGKLLGIEGIPDMIELLSDKEESRYKLEFQDLTGNIDFVEDWTYSWGRVDEAVIRTVAALTYDKPYSFNLGIIFYETRFEDIERESKLAEQWYEKNRDVILNVGSKE